MRIDCRIQVRASRAIPLYSHRPLIPEVPHLRRWPRTLRQSQYRCRQKHCHESPHRPFSRLHGHYSTPRNRRHAPKSTHQHTARQFTISEEAVKHRLSNVFDKTGVSTRLDLALFAISHKLVELDT